MKPIAERFAEVFIASKGEFNPDILSRELAEEICRQFGEDVKKECVKESYRLLRKSSLFDIFEIDKWLNSIRQNVIIK